jgi:hypothetical protein
VALRDSGGRAAQRARAKAAKAGAAGVAADEEDSAEPGIDLDDGPEDEFDEATANGAVAGTGPDEPVPAGRAASGSAPRSAPGARSGPRQQPRRTSAAKRRPAGKKKRR